MHKLYKIKVLHAAPKDSRLAVDTYLVARSDEEVAEWIQREKCHGHWLDPDEGDEPEMRYKDGDYDQEIPFRDWVMLNHGDLEDDEGYEDAYYGVTKWGWEEVPDASLEELQTVIRLGIAINYTPPKAVNKK